MAVWAAVTGIALWRFGHRLAPSSLHLMLACDTLWISMVVYRSTTADAAMITTFGYPWIGLYAAFFFSRRAMYGHIALLSAAYGIALFLAELPHADVANKAVMWLLVVITTGAMAAIIGRLVDTMRRHAERDHLTGLLNRRAFHSIARRAVAASGRTGENLTIAVLDLDNFKKVNDSGGHAAGDRLLVEVTTAWSKELRASDALARLGGDEFVVLMPGVDTEEARHALRRLQAASCAPWSVGIAQLESGENVERWLSRADADLYRTKQARAARFEQHADSQP